MHIHWNIHKHTHTHPVPRGTSTGTGVYESILIITIKPTFPVWNRPLTKKQVEKAQQGWYTSSQHPVGFIILPKERCWSVKPTRNQISFSVYRIWHKQIPPNISFQSSFHRQILLPYFAFGDQLFKISVIRNIKWIALWASLSLACRCKGCDGAQKLWFATLPRFLSHSLVCFGGFGAGSNIHRSLLMLFEIWSAYRFRRTAIVLHLFNADALVQVCEIKRILICCQDNSYATWKYVTL